MLDGDLAEYEKSRRTGMRKFKSIGRCTADIPTTLTTLMVIVAMRIGFGGIACCGIAIGSEPGGSVPAVISEEVVLLGRSENAEGVGDSVDVEMRNRELDDEAADSIDFAVEDPELDIEDNVDGIGKEEDGVVKDIGITAVGIVLRDEGRVDVVGGVDELLARSGVCVAGTNGTVEVETGTSSGD